MRMIHSGTKSKDVALVFCPTMTEILILDFNINLVEIHQKLKLIVFDCRLKSDEDDPSMAKR